MLRYFLHRIAGVQARKGHPKQLKKLQPQVEKSEVVFCAGEWMPLAVKIQFIKFYFSPFMGRCMKNAALQLHLFDCAKTGCWKSCYEECDFLLVII